MVTLWKNLRVIPILRLLVALQIGALALSPNLNSRSSYAASTPLADAPRRVNIPSFTGEIPWEQSAIFWFGVNDVTAPGVPGRNYVDVRSAYTPDGLSFRATIVDYYLWWDGDNPQPGDDLTQYDSIRVYLDTNHDRSGSPQTDDYSFLVSAYWWGDISLFLRQERGNGAGWDNAVSAWDGNSWMEWSDNGPNDNSGNIDFGWVAEYTIPWSALGLSGPPAEGTVWGLGVQLYDRDDQPPAGYVAPEYWPETFNDLSPATWGELHFGYANYQPPQAVVRGTTMIRAASPTDNTVEDAWMGGGGWCQGGHEGHGEDNHGDDVDLFVGTEIRPTHFPCFNKSYLRFALDSIPTGKVIISATLTLHDWGNADPTNDPPSWVSLFSVTDPWDEMGIHWNNAPLAQENISAAWIYPLTDFPGIPGIPYDWDATKAVAEAYAEDRPVSLAIYSSDIWRDTSKYLYSSEVDDWIVEGRPKLTVVWGDSSTTTLHKTATPQRVSNNDTVTYTLDWLGTGQSAMLTDTLPVGLSDPGSLTASSGTVNYDAGTRQITWSGTPDTDQKVTLTYTVTVQTVGPSILTNTALLIASGIETTTSASICIDCNNTYLPLLEK